MGPLPANGLTPSERKIVIEHSVIRLSFDGTWDNGRSPKDFGTARAVWLLETCKGSDDRDKGLVNCLFP